MGVALVFAAVEIVLVSVIATLFSFLYNLVVGITGGLEVTLVRGRLTVMMWVSPAAVVLTLRLTDFWVFNGICRSICCGARSHSPARVVTS